MLSFLKKWMSKNSIFILLTLFFIDLIIKSLIKGGRWDLYQHFAMADKLLSGKSCYSTFHDGFFQASSPYFPGITFFSLFITKINVEFRSEIMLFLSVLIGILFILGLNKIHNKINLNSDKNNTSMVITITLSIWFFKDWQMYMIELKPDTLLLLLTIGLFFVIEKIKLFSTNLFYHLLFIICLYLIGIVKQHGIAIYIGVFFYFLNINELKLKTRLIILFNILLTGTFVLVTLFSTKNCINNCIVIFSKHNLQSIHDIKNFLLIDFNNQWLIYILSITNLFTLIARYKFLVNQEKLWYFLTLPWLIISLISFVKIGGNNSNIQSGFITQIPFYTLLIQNLFNNHFYLSKLKYAVIFFSSIVILLDIRENYKTLCLNKEIESQNIQFLKKFKDKKTLYNSDYYDLIYKSKIIPKTDMITANDFYLANENMIDYRNEINSKKYDLIFSDISLFPDKISSKIILKNYTFYLENDIPSNLAYKILIPKK